MPLRCKISRCGVKTEAADFVCKPVDFFTFL
nr:MAG TPA: hypothetical protein [Caudoviricetes sp.]